MTPIVNNELDFSKQEQFSQDYLLAVMTPDQKVIWMKYYNLVLSKMAIPTQSSYVSRIMKLISIIKKSRFEDFAKEDFEHFIIQLRSETENIRTQNIFKQTIKTFFRWFYLNHLEQPLPDFFKFKFLNREAVGEAVIADDLLSDDQVWKIVNHGRTLRDQALIALLFEGFARISEILRLKIKDIKEDPKGFTFINKKITKLGQRGRVGEYEVRPIVVNRSLIYLKNWLSIHPDNQNPEAYIFITTYGGHTHTMTRQSALAMIKVAAKKAGIEKRVFCHLVRYSAISGGRDKGLSDKQTRHKAGWTVNSDRLKTYDKFSKNTVLEQAREMGLVTERKRSEEGQICPRCKTMNYDSKFCRTCFTDLTIPYEPETYLREEIEKRDKEVEGLQIQVSNLVLELLKIQKTVIAIKKNL